MKEQKKCVPEIRFAGFTDDWEQRKLGEIAEIRRGASPRPIQDGRWFNKNSEIGWLRISDVTEQNGRIQFIEQRLSKEGQEKTLVLDSPHLILSIAATVGKPVINFVPTGIHDGFIVFINLKADMEFMFQWLEIFRPNWQKLGQSGSQININSELVREQKILLPISIEEQTAIGNFFKQLDDTIALHQRTLEKYQKLKISYLEKMFPKENEQFPELRFPNFTDAWEQRKLGDVLTESRIIGSNGAVAKKLTVKLWKKGVIAKEEQYAGSLATQYFVRKSGQFIYGKLDFLNQAFGIIPKELDGYESTLDSPAFDISKQVNENFLLEYIARDSFYLLHGNIANGSRKAKRIHSHTLLNMPFIAPNLEEQTAIGNFFKQLDDTITLHQREVEKYKKIKQAYLEKMFI